MHGLVVLDGGIGGVSQKRAERRLARERGRLRAAKLSGHGEGDVEPRADSLAVPFGARDLTGKVHRNPEALRLRRAQAQAFVQQARRVHERVAVHHAVARELGVLAPGDEADHAALLRAGAVRPEPPEVAAGPLRILGQPPHRGPWALTR